VLSQLHIENIALIDNLDVEFKNGFTVLTGETGAGKSILIDSINMVLGERASKELIRNGRNFAFVSALFSALNEYVINELSNYGIQPDDDGSLIIERQISLDGKNTCRINGRPVTVGILKEIGKLLVNIHGQHDNQSLLLVEKHIDFLDKFADNSDLLEDYYKLYSKLQEIKKQIEGLQMDDKEKARRIELLKYQINEINNAGLKPGEEIYLNEQKKAIHNSEKILNALIESYTNLYEKDGSAIELIEISKDKLSEITGFSESVREAYDKIDNIFYELQDIIEILRDYKNSLNFAETDIDSIESRLDIIYRLKQKYGANAEEIIEYGKKCEEELSEIEFSEERIVKLQKEYDEILGKVKDLADKLTQSRIEAGRVLEKKIIDVLSYLNMPKVRFVVEIRRCSLTEKGEDEVEFLISANPGEPPKPLSKIASGGELSRIMLAIKSIFSEIDYTSTLIFDEIDTGVSGSAAEKIGRKMKELSSTSQVICVTHLSQIAAIADNHYKISKHTINENTFTQLEVLDTDKRVMEIARIISGENITQSALAAAKEILSK